MSELVIFVIGTIIFAITVYGTVTIGGLLLTRRQFDENDQLEVLNGDGLPDGLPTDIRY
ncbi:MAG: hypothetical protein AAFZ07_13360 [Actinomycetota bacterium]